MLRTLPQYQSTTSYNAVPFAFGSYSIIASNFAVVIEPLLKKSDPRIFATMESNFLVPGS